MEEAVIAIAIIIAILATIYEYFGAFGITAVIALVIFLFYKFMKSLKKDEDNRYQEAVNTSYVQKAMEFIEFYEQLPKSMFFILTPEYVGVRIPSDESNDYFGISVQTYLDMSRDQPEFETTFREIFFKQAQKSLGGAQGVAMFQKLGLQVRLHDDDNDFPIVYMSLYEFNAAQRKDYVKAIEKQYKSLYHKELNIYHLNDY